MTDRYENIRKALASIKTLARYEPDTVYIGTGEYVAECVRADDGDYYLAADVDAAIDAAIDAAQQPAADPGACPACNRAWSEHRIGYSASACKMKQPAARPPKPTECMNGCPDRQVCDHCQWPPGPDQQPEARVGGEVSYAECCDTPAYCSSVRRCTANDTPPPSAVPEIVGWLHEVVWEDGTAYSFYRNQPGLLGPRPGLVSERIGRAAFIAAAPEPGEVDSD